MSRLSLVERGAARILRRGFRLTRSLMPEQGRALLRPLASRAHRRINSLEAAGYRDTEALLRAQLAHEPDNARLWYELGLALDAQESYDDAIDALFRAAELGPPLQLVTQTFQTRAPIRTLVNRPDYLDRMNRLADASPADADVQLAAGAFMLDRGEAGRGRPLIRRGYELLLSDQPDALADGPANQAPAPAFLILGPHKTATTSLHALLAQHPRVVATPRKELHFWGKRHGRPPELYRDYFPPLAASSGFISGEATANYLQTPEAATAAAQRFPGVRTIVLRRDPVSRAYSHYQMMRRLQMERREFDEAIADEQELLGGSPPLRMDDVPDVRAPYLLGSCILPYLQMWSGTIPPEQVLVIDSAYFAEHRQETLDAVCSYVGLEPFEVTDEQDRNVGEYSRISDDSRARLSAWFEPHETALDAFLAAHPSTIHAGGDGAGA